VAIAMVALDAKHHSPQSANQDVSSRQSFSSILKAKPR